DLPGFCGDVAVACRDNISDCDPATEVVVTRRPTCPSNSSPFPADPEMLAGYNDWKNSCQNRGKVKPGICKVRAFTDYAGDSDSVRSCERAISELERLRDRLAELDEQISRIDDEIYELDIMISDEEFNDDFTDMESCPDGR